VEYRIVLSLEAALRRISQTFSKRKWSPLLAEAAAKTPQQSLAIMARKSTAALSTIKGRRLCFDEDESISASAEIKAHSKPRVRERNNSERCQRGANHLSSVPGRKPDSSKSFSDPLPLAKLRLALKDGGLDTQRSARLEIPREDRPGPLQPYLAKARVESTDLMMQLNGVETLSRLELGKEHLNAMINDPDTIVLGTLSECASQTFTERSDVAKTVSSLQRAEDESISKKAPAASFNQTAKTHFISSKEEKKPRPMKKTTAARKSRSQEAPIFQRHRNDACKMTIPVSPKLRTGKSWTQSGALLRCAE
jgi:hypothetical protein